MPGTGVSLLLHHVRRLAGASAADDQLLSDFLTRRDEAAFAALVGRHGPMVLNLCRRILRDSHAAEDVFQATFLVLADRATGIRRRASLASWLHGVAYRLAVRAKRQRMPTGDVGAAAPSPTDPTENLAWQEMLGILHEELERLSERYKAPLVLCYLDGRTQDEAAAVLGWSLGTLRRRLDQGRALLETRLRGRGVSLSAALGGVLAAGGVTVPAPLQAATVAAARPAILAMTQGGWVMLSASVKKLLAVVACVLVGGVGVWAYTTRQAAPKTPPPEEGPVTSSREVFQQANDAVEACGPDVNAYLLMALAVREARRGNADVARRRFAQAADRFATTRGHPRAIVLGMLAYRIAEAGDRASAAWLLEEARLISTKLTKENERNDVLPFLAECLAERGDVARAMDWAKDIRDETTRLNAYRRIAVAQARAGDVAGALRTVDLIRTPYTYFKLIPWEAIVAAQLKVNDDAGAKETLRLALDAVEESLRKKWDNDLMEQAAILTRSATAQARAGAKSAAVETLARAEKVLAGIERSPSIEILAESARAYAAAGARKKAEAAVRRFQTATESVEVKLSPFVTLVRAQLALGDFAGAAKSAEGMSRPHEMEEVCHALTEAGQKEAALAVARAAKTPDLRAWGLLGVGRGVLDQLGPEGVPTYRKGTFALEVPYRPAPVVAKAAEPTPEEQMRAAVEKWEKEWATFNERRKQARTEEERQRMLENDRPTGDEAAKALLALARKHAGKPVAFDALAWVVEYTRETAAAREALALLRKDYLANKKIGEVCTIATYNPYRDEAEKLLRAVLANGPHATAKGQACLALANNLRDRAKAEKLYERVLAEFADVFPSRHSEPLGKTARRALDEIRLFAVGKPAPEIEGKDLDGKPLKLNEHRGKVVVLVFWAKWCRPCRAMIPHERALVKRLASKPFVLLGVNGDADREDLAKWLAKDPLPWRSWWDGDNGAGDGQGRIARAWNVTGWPTVYVLDGRGTIRYKNVHEKELDAAVDALVKETTANASRP